MRRAAVLGSNMHTEPLSSHITVTSTSTWLQTLRTRAQIVSQVDNTVTALIGELLQVSGKLPIKMTAAQGQQSVTCNRIEQMSMTL